MWTHVFHYHSHRQTNRHWRDEHILFQGNVIFEYPGGKDEKPANEFKVNELVLLFSLNKEMTLSATAVGPANPFVSTPKTRFRVFIDIKVS